MNDVFIRYGVNMPLSIKGFVSEDENGDYNIFINPKLTAEMQKLVLQHELRHVANCDFDNGLSIIKVEKLKLARAD